MSVRGVCQVKCGRRWACVIAAVVMVAGVACGGVGPRLAMAGPDDQSSNEQYPSSNGKWGVWPDEGPTLDTFFDKHGMWRDGWCRRGERGYAVVIDVSGAPKNWRGDLTPTPEHIRRFGPTVSDGWIVRCHEGLHRNFSTTNLEDVAGAVGLSTQYTNDYVAPPGSFGVQEGLSQYQILHIRMRLDSLDSRIGRFWKWDGGVWIHANDAGDLSGEWPPNGWSMKDPWPSAANNRMIHEGPYGSEVQTTDITAGSIIYVTYGAHIMIHPSEEKNTPTHVYLGDAALHPKVHQNPKTGQQCPGWKLTPQFSDGLVNGCVPKSAPGPGPKPDPRPGSGGGPKPGPHHRPGGGAAHGGRVPGGQHGSGVHHGPQDHRGGDSRTGTTGHGTTDHGAARDGDRAGGPVRLRVARQHRHAALPSASVSPSASASPSPSPSVSPSVSASPSPSVSPSATPSPSVSAGVVVSPSPGDGRVWGSEQQGPPASDGARRRVPGWAWGAGAGVLVAAGVVAWWMTRGRRRDREDDEVGTDLFE